MKMKSILSDKHQKLLTDDGWKCWGKPPSFDVHDEYWTRELLGVLPRCADNPDKPLTIELQVFAKRVGFPGELGLGVQLVLVGTKRDGMCARLMAYGMPEGVLDMLEIEGQTAQLVGAWKEMNKLALVRKDGSL